MTSRHRSLTPMVSTLLGGPLAAVACGTSLSSDAGPVPKPAAAPSLKFFTASGEHVSIAAQQNTRLIVLPFWKTSCDPCKIALAELDMLHREFASRGLEVHAINIDAPSSRGHVQGWIDRGQWSFDTLFDPETENHARFNPGGECPFYVVLAADGSVVRSHGGYRKGDGVELGAFLRTRLPPA